MIIITFVLSHLSSILSLGGLAVGAGGFLFGSFKHQQAKAATADAKAQVAQIQASAATGEANAQAQANQDLINKQQAAQEVAAVPVNQLDAQLQALGAETK